MYRSSSVVYANQENICGNHSSARKVSVSCGVCVHTGGSQEMYLEVNEVIYVKIASN